MGVSDIGSISHELEEALLQIKERQGMNRPKTDKVQKNRTEEGQGAVMNKELQNSGEKSREFQEREVYQDAPGEGCPAEKKNSLIHPQDAYLAAFFVPVLIMVIIYIQRQIFPFGEESFLRTDMYHQYAPFFAEFRHKLTQGGSLLYSWNVGMGVNFAALYAYYLASPFNWFLLLCPRGLIIEFMTYLIVLKTGLCGLSMTYYLQKHYKKPDFGAAFFGIFYALSGYMAAYSWNIMWLDWFR